MDFRVRRIKLLATLGVTSLLLSSTTTTNAQTPTVGTKKPNILVIMGDDVGWFNVGAYNQGIVSVARRRIWISWRRRA